MFLAGQWANDAAVPSWVFAPFTCLCGACGSLATSRIKFFIAAVAVAGAMLAAAPYAQEPARTQPLSLGADIYIGELNELKQFGRVGAVVGLLGDAPVCNAGTQPLDWLVPPNSRHPLMNFNLYRLKDGRLTQIGQSWTKHGLGASQDNACGFGCNPYPNTERLGVGCSDTYSAQFNNNTLSYFGPRFEINPWTGVWTHNGSHFQANGPNHAHGPIDHRLQVHDDDLDPALNAGATYFYECYVLSYDDADHSNSIAHEPVMLSGSPGGTWTFDLDAQQTVLGPAISSWPGATVTLVPQSPVNDGQVHCASKVQYLGGNTWRYEYAIYNHDMDRGIRAFSVPRHADASIVNVGFYAVASHEEPYSNDPWTIDVAGDAVAWSTQTFAVNPFANVLRWGTMYNFWFDSSYRPASVTATLTPFKPGTPASFAATVPGPMLPPVPADITGDGLVNVDDLLAVIGAWGSCSPLPASCDADIAPAPDGDGQVDVDDLLDLINNWS